MKREILRWIGHSHWMRGRDRILRAFEHPDRQQPQAFTVDFFGRSYTGNMANFIDWSVYYYGAFQIHEIRLLAAVADALRARGGPVNIFDVGANIGHHTLFLSGHADHVYSFEPFHVVRSEMERKLRHAGVSNVSIFPVALGNTNSAGQFHPPMGANQGTGTLGDALPDNASDEVLEVSVVRGDDFFAEKKLPPISLMKMDVEGYEPKALAGMRETLWRDRPPMFVEIQRDEYTGAAAQQGTLVKDLLYPDHLIFEVSSAGADYVLKPFLTGNTEEALVIPRELAGIVPGTEAR